MLSNNVSCQTGKELLLEEGDFLDVYKINREDVYNFIISRKPFCGYCKPITEYVPWAISERKIEEWS
jgi:hypothetical protein